MKLRYGLATLAAAGLFAAAAPAQAPFAMLSGLEKGRWTLIERGGANRSLCLGDASQLLQIMHPGAQCSRYTIVDTAGEVTVHYTCGRGGHGRTTIRMETPRLVQVGTQGMAGGQPFSHDFEARRTGGC